MIRDALNPPPEPGAYPSSATVLNDISTPCGSLRTVRPMIMVEPEAPRVTIPALADQSGDASIAATQVRMAFSAATSARAGPAGRIAQPSTTATAAARASRRRLTA